MQGSTMTMTSTTSNLATNQFPQPVRPPNSSYDDGYEIPSTSNNYPPHHQVVGYPQQSNIDDSYMHVVPPTTMAKEEEGEKKVALVDKLVNRIMDKYEKIQATIRDQVKLEEMIANERNRQVNSRGIEQPLEAGQQEKLERFKIRTVVAGEVATEDDKNNK